MSFEVGDRVTVPVNGPTGVQHLPGTIEKFGSAATIVFVELDDGITYVTNPDKLELLQAQETVGDARSEQEPGFEGHGYWGTDS